MSMKGTLALLAVSGVSLPTAGVFSEFISDGMALSRLGMLGLMSVALVVCVFYIWKLVRFIADTVIPLQKTLGKLDANLTINTEALTKVHDTIRDCNKRP